MSQHSLNRLRDAESDKAVFDNLLWCLLGGLIGFFTNVVTGDRSVDAPGYVFLTFIAVTTIATFTMRRRLVRRLTQARKRVHHGGD
ncbi:hypothetical protein AAH991_13390 [Microbispora sp. ZYX-F-249]|uniref:Uncharacterized protein n=1 Tax=Microbispora maris TaxID=3144104 RepID=A0ABV0ANF9_9ACTN